MCVIVHILLNIGNIHTLFIKHESGFEITYFYFSVTLVI